MLNVQSLPEACQNCIQSGLTGKDATEDFEEIGHSNAAKEMLAKYLIGDFDVSLLMPPSACSMLSIKASHRTICNAQHFQTRHVCTNPWRLGKCQQMLLTQLIHQAFLLHPMLGVYAGRRRSKDKPGLNQCSQGKAGELAVQQSSAQAVASAPTTSGHPGSHLCAKVPPLIGLSSASCSLN